MAGESADITRVKEEPEEDGIFEEEIKMEGFYSSLDKDPLDMSSIKSEPESDFPLEPEVTPLQVADTVKEEWIDDVTEEDDGNCGVVNDSLRFKGAPGVPIDISSLTKGNDEGEKGRKKYFCIFCKRMVSSLPRHLERKHGDQEEVKEFSTLPRKSKERIALISKLRGMGAVELKSSSNVMLVSQKTRVAELSTTNYLPCSNCGNVFKSRSMRKHYQWCTNQLDTTLVQAQNHHQMISSEEQKHNVFASVVPVDSLSVSDKSSLTKPMDEEEEGKKNERRKQYFCIFCKKMICRFPRHLEQKHGDQEEVKELSTLPRKSKERIALISKLRGMGAVELKSSSNVMLVSHRMGGTDPPTTEYIPCCNCGNFFKSINMTNHYKRCTNLPNQTQVLAKCRRRLISDLKSYHNADMSEILADVLSSMSGESHILELVQKDPTIIQFGNKLCKCDDRMIDSSKSAIRRKLRVMAMITHTMYSIDTDPAKELSVAFYYNHTKFDLFEQAVMQHMGYDGTHYRSPTQGAAIGRVWLDCGGVLRKVLEDTNAKDNVEKVDQWKMKYVSRFHKDIEKPAAIYCQKVNSSRKREIPDNEDVAALNTYLIECIDNHVKKLRIAYDYDDWQGLSVALLVLITVFNRRRASEVEGALLEHFEKCFTIKDVTNDQMNCLSEEAKKQLSLYIRFDVADKKSRAVTVMLHNDLYKHVQLVLQHRAAAGVFPDNPYLFASGDTHFNCSEALRKAAIASEAKRPELLTTFKIRKHFVALVLGMEMHDSEKETVTQYLSYYMRPPAVQCMPYQVIEMVFISVILETSLTEGLPNIEGKGLLTIHGDGPCGFVDSNPCPSARKEQSDSLLTRYLRNRDGPCEFVDSNPCPLARKEQSDSLRTRYLRHRKIVEHYLITSSSEEQEEHSDFQPKKQKLNSSSNEDEYCPGQDIKRRFPWTTRQVAVLEDNFKKYLDIGQCPPGRDIAKVIQENRHCMAHRTVMQVRAYFSNVKTGKIKRTLNG